MIKLKGKNLDHLPEFAELTASLSDIEAQHNYLTEERARFLLIEHMLERAQLLTILLYNLKMVKSKSKREEIWQLEGVTYFQLLCGGGDIGEGHRAAAIAG